MISETYFKAAAF